MQPTTPIGSRTINEFALDSSKSYVAATDAAWLKLLIGKPTWTSWESHLAMPVSLEMAVASSSMRAPSASPILVKYFARSSTGVDDQARNAALAAATAASTSSAVPAGMVAIICSFVESITSIVCDEVELVQVPLMYNL